MTPIVLHTPAGTLGAQPAAASTETDLIGQALRWVIGPDGVGVTQHFLDQMVERGISIWQVVDTFINGVWNWNEASGQIEIYGQDVEIILRDGLLITVWFL